MNYGEFFRALRQRRIVQTIVVYVGGSWGILQALNLFQSTYNWPRAVFDAALFVLACGLGAAATIAWFHGERGHQRVPRTEAAILSLLLGVAAFGGWALAVRPADSGAAAAGSGAAGDAVPPERTLAVMPFVNQGQDTSLAWLERGIVELLTTDLAQVPSLRVVSSQRVFDLLHQQGAAQAAIVAEPVALKVAHTSNAGYIVRGAIYHQGSSIRLDAELVDAATGITSLAAHAEGREVFPLVDSLAARLAGKLSRPGAGPGAPAAASAPAPLSDVTTSNLDAFREYHLGLEAERNLRRREAAEHYRRAVELDSSFPQALVRLGVNEVLENAIPEGVLHLARARANLARAPERDSLYVRGLLALVQNDLPTAAGALERLTRRYPDEKDAWLWLSGVYSAYPARRAQREGVLRQVLRLDPGYAPAYNELAYEFARRGDYARADSFAQRYVALQPGEPNPLDTRGEILEWAGRYGESRASFLAALRLGPAFLPALEHLARVAARSGHVDQGLRDLAPFLAGSDPVVQVRARLLSGDLRLWQGDVEGARSAYARAREEAARIAEPGAQGLALRRQVAFWALIGDHARIIEALGPMLRVKRVGITRAYAVALGESGRLDELRSLRASTARAATTTELRDISGGVVDDLDAYLAYYAHDWTGAVRHFQAARAGWHLPDDMLDDPLEVLALLNAGRAPAALPLVQAFDTAGFDSPIARHTDLYLQARVYEAVGRGPDAVRDYRRLLADWGRVIQRFPQFRDVPERLRRLGG